VDIAVMACVDHDDDARGALTAADPGDRVRRRYTNHRAG